MPTTGLGARIPYRAALVAGAVGVGVVLVLNVPGVAELRRHRSAATVLSHLAVGLTALGLSPRFPRWVAGISGLSPRRLALCLAAALLGPLAVMVAGLLVAPSYGHDLFTREWGIIEPLQFVLWLTAAWLAFERARSEEPGGIEHRVFRLAGWGCVLFAIEETDYLGLVSLVARAAGVPQGRIGGHHIGGLHDVLNALGKASLALGALALGAGAFLLFAWCVSRGWHRVVARELFSPTALPLVGSVVFIGLSQLADMDHPTVSALAGRAPVLRELCEEPAELLANVCVNAALLAKLAARREEQPASASVLHERTP